MECVGNAFMSALISVSVRRTVSALWRDGVYAHYRCSAASLSLAGLRVLVAAVCQVHGQRWMDAIEGRITCRPTGTARVTARAADVSHTANLRWHRTAVRRGEQDLAAICSLRYADRLVGTPAVTIGDVLVDR